MIHFKYRLWPLAIIYAILLLSSSAMFTPAAILTGRMKVHMKLSLDQNICLTRVHARQAQD
ncbi:Uncharacterized protein APZ42_011637 [Daphnia magna]|uniref:Uncharacterized protein n=1 Tax=Daphnia magna TaxID=35525 RepID=A0A0P6C1T7_9CRUS|nr:Uncharacterized protein APZ42_011637 [Daphnia magna]